MKFDSKRRDKMIDDLLSKFPIGPRGVIDRTQYRKKYQWSAAKSEYCDLIVPDDDKSKYYGYDIEDFVRLDYAVGNLRDYIRKRWDDISWRAVTRRYNRLYDRIHPTVRSFKSGEGHGIWKVDFSDHSLSMFVIAGNGKTAELLGKTMVAGSGLISNRIYRSRVNVADPELLAHYNNKNFGNVESKLKSSKASLIKLKEKIESLKKLQLSLSDFGSLQPDILTKK